MPLASLLSAGGLGSGVVGRAVVQLVGDTAQLKASMVEGEAAVASSTGTMNAETAAASGGMSTAFKASGLAVVALGAAAIHMSMQFESSMNKLVGLVGLGQGEVNKMTESVLHLATETGRAPQELADALYFVTSAGLRGAKAMDALRVSALAAEAGLGETKTIADAVTSALNAYAGSGLTATTVVNDMIAAVRTGKMPADALAGSLGAILPVASQLGVSFDQVTAALASASRVGLSTTRAATGLRFILSQMMAPSTQAAAALTQVYGSLDALHQELTTRGLLAVLTDMKNRLSQADFAHAVGGARGLVLALTLVGKNASQVSTIFDQVKNSAGSLQHAVTAVRQTTADEARRIGAALEDVLIRLGQNITPVLHIVANGLLLISHVLQPLIPYVVQLGIAFLAYKAIQFLPGLLFLVAQAMEALAIGLGSRGIGLGVSLAGAAEGLGNFAGSLQGLVIPLAIATAAAIGFNALLAKADEQLGQKTVEAAQAGGTALDEWAAKLKHAHDLMHSVGLLGDLIPGFALLRGSVDRTKQHTESLIQTQQRQATTAAVQTRANVEVGRSLDLLPGRAVYAENSISGLAAAHAAAAKQATAQWTAEQVLAGGLLGVSAASLSAEQAQTALSQARDTLNKLTAEGKQGTNAYQAALLQERQAAVGATQAQMQLVQTVVDYVKSQNSSKASTAEAIGQIRAYGREAGLTKGEVNALIQQVIGLIRQYHNVPGQINTTFTVDTDPAVRQMESFNAAMKKAGIPVHMDLSGALHGKARGGEIPGTGAGDHVPILAEPGEFMVRKKAVDYYGKTMMHAINTMNFQLGGLVPDAGGWAAMVNQLAVSHPLLRLGLPSVASLTMGGASIHGVHVNVPGTAAQWLTQALGVTGEPLSWLRGLEYIMMHESGGDPSARNPQAVRSGEHASGLMQTIPSTFAAYAMPGHGNIWNPIDNAIAAIRYIAAVYGTPYQTPWLTGGKAYAEGGMIVEPVVGVGMRTGRSYTFGEHGPERVVKGTGGDKMAVFNLELHLHGFTGDPDQAARVVGGRMMDEIRKSGMMADFTTA